MLPGKRRRETRTDLDYIAAWLIVARCACCRARTEVEERYNKEQTEWRELEGIYNSKESEFKHLQDEETTHKRWGAPIVAQIWTVTRMT